MSEELFEKYLQNALSEEEKRRLSEILSAEDGKRTFVEFVQEWSLLGEVSREMTASSGQTSRFRARVRPHSAGRRPVWGWWAAGLAAAMLFVLGLVLVTRPAQAPVVAPSVTSMPNPPSVPKPEPRLKVAREPVPAPREVEKIPAPKPRSLPELPKPTPVVKKEPVEAPAPPKPESSPQPKAPAPAPGAPRPGATIAAIAVFAEVEGEVQVVSAGKEIPAKSNMWFLAAQGLRVGAKGRAVLRFSDETVLEFAPLTIVDRIVERDRSGRTATGKTVDLVDGSVTADVVRQPAGRPLVIRSPLAEATVLGTKLTFSAEADSARLEVWRGRVRLKRRADGASIVVTTGHRGVVARKTPLRPEIILLTREFQDGVSPDPAYAGTRDTHINQVKQDENVGRVDELEADGDETAGQSIWSLLRWDVSSLPRDAVVLSAVITLNIQGTSKSVGYRMFGAKRPWVETEATWKEFAAGRSWRSPGARSVVDRYRGRLAEFAPRREGPIRIPLNPEGVALLQSWVRSPGQNFGLLIGSNASTDGFRFDSRESSKSPRRPRLTVTYTLGARR